MLDDSGAVVIELMNRMTVNEINPSTQQDETTFPSIYHGHHFNHHHSNQNHRNQAG